MKATEPMPPERNILILQGGGALGAYQAGVFEAIHASGLDSDWVVGTSIGAINAVLIAGNRPGRRLEHLYEFWSRVGQGWFSVAAALADGPSGQYAAQLHALTAMTCGVPHFFTPRWDRGFAFGMPVAPDSAGYYDPAPLRKTLEELVDFDYLADSPIRLSVGAVDVESGRMRYFDSRAEKLGIEHILASSALPPAFPAVPIEGRHYWDGGMHSNTPLEWVLKDMPRRHSLCFLATLWRLQDAPPGTLSDVLRRSKELRYASRVDNLIGIEQELHRLRHGISMLAARLPEAVRRERTVAETIALGCRSVYHLVRLQAPRLPGEDQAKDLEFIPSRIEQRWAAGKQDASRALSVRPWEQPVASEQGIVLHTFGDGEGAADGG